MATVFETQVMNKVGEALITGKLAITTAMLDDWLTEGAQVIISKMPAPLWRLFAKEDAAFAPTTGLAVESHKIVDVFRNDGTIDQPCRQIDENMRGRHLDTEDIGYATVTDPNWYVDYSTTATPTLKIIPVSATATIGKVIRLNFPTIDASGDSTVNGFPNDLEPLLVDYALMQAKQREASYMRRKAHSLWETATTGFSARALDALTKAQDLIDNLSATDFESYLTAEDVELAGLTVNGASQEVNRALAEMQTGMGQSGDYLKMGNTASQEYNAMKTAWAKQLTDWIGINLA